MNNSKTTAMSFQDFDVFLSYNSRDRALVGDIAQKLSSEGIKPFFDRWYLAPGQRWQSKLEQILLSCKAVAVCFGSGEMGSWQQREVGVALERQNKTPEFPVIPILLPGCEPPLGFLKQLTWIDLRSESLDQITPIIIGAIHGIPPGYRPQDKTDAIRANICPYRGLLHFREEDAPFFFGRDATIQKLLNTTRQESFLAVVGASGSGKSSLVRAGLVPRLRRDRDVAWDIVTFVPGDQPLRALAAALIPLLETSITETDRLVEVGKLANHFISSTVFLRDVLGRILEKQTGTDRLLLVIDQWEEIYTLTQDTVVRRRFIDELLDATAHAPLTVLLTLRGDFVDKALGYRPLSDRLQGAQINLGPMNTAELSQAISQPAAQVKLNFEAGLSARILNDVGDEPGNLPLLAFVLRRLWEERNHNQLLHTTYDKMGGLQGAIADRAEHIINTLTADEQKSAMQLLVQLVHFGENATVTRRRQRLANIPARSQVLLAKLVDERLLVTSRSPESGDEMVEVAHEILIRHWERLRTYLDQNRDYLLWREHLLVMRASWLRNKTHKSHLLTVPLLNEAFQWLDERPNELGGEELDYIFRSSSYHAEDQFDIVMGSSHIHRVRTKNPRPSQLLRYEKQRWSLFKLRATVYIHRMSRSFRLWIAREAARIARKQAAQIAQGHYSIRWGPIWKTLVLCAVMCIGALGIVWLKSQSYQMGSQINRRTLDLQNIKEQNAKMLLLEQALKSENQQGTNTNAVNKSATEKQQKVMGQSNRIR
jgi:energy-coupling factor transporter ATP-binding protein EcfA2